MILDVVVIRDVVDDLPQVTPQIVAYGRELVVNVHRILIYSALRKGIYALYRSSRKTYQQLAVDVHLNLIVSTIADSHRS